MCGDIRSNGTIRTCCHWTCLPQIKKHNKNNMTSFPIKLPFNPPISILENTTGEIMFETTNSLWYLNKIVVHVSIYCPLTNDQNHTKKLKQWRKWLGYFWLEWLRMSVSVLLNQSDLHSSKNSLVDGEALQRWGHRHLRQRTLFNWIVYASGQYNLQHVDVVYNKPNMTFK